MKSTDTQYWLVKSEADVYPLEQLRNDGRTAWTAVRNYEARNLMRDKMKVGDGVLFYHSTAKPSAIVGLAEVCSASYPDPTQFDKKSEYYDPKSTQEHPRWMLVDIAYRAHLKQPIPLDQLKEIKGLETMALLKRGRLSVQPVTPEEWKIILHFSKKLKELK
jgi:predicted RNA-binding protein with PUA-like domain